LEKAIKSYDAEAAGKLAGETVEQGLDLLKAIIKN
jgi:hypothetical protein